jgi:hypothetical protein
MVKSIETNVPEYDLILPVGKKKDVLVDTDDAVHIVLEQRMEIEIELLASPSLGQKESNLI